MATHFKGPLLFSAQRPALQNLNTSMWPDQYYYMDDFGTGAVDENNNWTVVKDTGASVTVGDSATGELLLNSAATTDNDGASIQQKAETFSTPSIVGDSLWFETRIKNSTVAQSDIIVGLTETFTTNPEAMFASANLIAFVLTDGSAVIQGATEAGGTQTVVTFNNVALSTLADDTFITLGFKFTKGDTTDRVEFYINRQLVGVSTTNIPASATLLKVGACSISGNATGTRITTLDYVTCSQDRNVTYTGSPA
jgi:hypothetical protein|tara:strand:- start:745 stop:1503 length:759 start_codon:yes stop_codon:yes gene_type:complete